MLGMLHHIRKFLLSALKRYSPVRLLQYLLALCRAVFSRCRSKCSGQDLSHESLPKTLTLAVGKGSFSEEGIVTPVGHVISACRTPAQVEQGLAQIVESSPSTRNDRSEPPLRQNAPINSKPSLKKCWRCMWTNKWSPFNTVYLLDHPGSIRRSVAHTQIEDKNNRFSTNPRSQNRHKVWSTDVKKWRKFSATYAKDIQEVGLLATVLLVANMSFLAIQSIDNEGISYLPQKFSYLSLLAALASIVMGSAVRSPRLFTNRGPFYFQAMIVILGFPFELFLYSILFFLLALLVHCAKHAAVFQLVFAGIFAVLLLCCLVIYWLITEPCNDTDSFDKCHQDKTCCNH